MRKITSEKFIEKAIIIHGDKYDYSLAEYKNAKTKVKIICSEHGVFEQIPNVHLKGHGCPKCGGSYKKSSENFIGDAKNTHGNKYDYSLVEYKNSKTKVKIICPIHGVFEQIPNSHLTGSGCLYCVGMYKTTVGFINESNIIHNSKYDYSLAEYKTAKSKVDIICPDHGIFKQRPSDHLSGYGCPKCNSSKGELEISIFLASNNVDYEPQYKFNGCKSKRILPFDFYLPEYNICIEYDGEQHFKIVEHWGGEKSLIDRQKRDKIKDDFCKENNIKLLRIRYDENIEEKMKEIM